MRATTGHPQEVIAAPRVHIGAGPVHLPGWFNVDIQPYEGLDLVLDVTHGLPFTGTRRIFAEHFIEHLSYDAGAAFLRECRRVLAEDGILRLTTPNLDWVYVSQYHWGQWNDSSERVRDCFWMNKSFHGWGHQFLYNDATLRETLLAAGFAHVEFLAYGQSSWDDLEGLERHELYPDHGDISHLLVCEASGRGSSSSDVLPQPIADYRSAVAAR